MKKTVSNLVAQARDSLGAVSPAALSGDNQEAFRQLFYAVDALADAVEALDK